MFFVSRTGPVGSALFNYAARQGVEPQALSALQKCFQGIAAPDQEEKQTIKAIARYLARFKTDDSLKLLQTDIISGKLHPWAEYLKIEGPFPDPIFKRHFDLIAPGLHVSYVCNGRESPVFLRYDEGNKANLLTTRLSLRQ